MEPGEEKTPPAKKSDWGNSEIQNSLLAENNPNLAIIWGWLIFK